MAAKFMFGRGIGVGLGGGLVAAGAIACAQPAPDSAATTTTEVPDAAPNVVVTTSVLCDLTEQIAEETINLTCLLAPGQDPHTYQPQPTDRLAVDEADLVLFDGYNFAPAVIGLVQASTTEAPRIAVYEAAVPNPLMGQGHDHDHDHGTAESHDHAHDDPEAAHDHDDHAHDAGDEHHHDETATGEATPTSDQVPDPHIWHSAENTAAIAAVIADELAQVNPEQADRYQQNADQLVETLTELDEWIQVQVNTIPAGDRHLVTTHDSFRYFADAYGLEVKGALSGLSTAEKPSAKVLTDLADQVKAAQVPAIFAESTTNPELINAIAREAAVGVAEQPLFVEGPGTADSAAPTTQAMLVVNTCTIVNALGGTCDATQAPLP